MNRAINFKPFIRFFSAFATSDCPPGLRFIEFHILGREAGSLKSAPGHFDVVRVKLEANEAQFLLVGDEGLGPAAGKRNKDIVSGV